MELTKLRIWFERHKDEKHVILFAVGGILVLLGIALWKEVDGVIWGTGMTAVGGALGWYFKSRHNRHNGGGNG